MSSDIDILLLTSLTDPKETVKLRKQIECMLPEYFDEFPYVDVRVARKILFDTPDDSEYGRYMQNCKKDGVMLWERKR